MKNVTANTYTDEARLKDGIDYAERLMLGEHQIDKKTLKFYDIDLTNKSILDFGSGMGGVSCWYAKHWDCQVTGIDLDPFHVDVANMVKKKHELDNVEFVAADVTKEYANIGPFDFITMNDVVEHLDDDIIEDVLGSVTATLKKGGQMFVTFPSWEGPWASHLNKGNSLPWCQYYPGFLREAVIEKYNRKLIGALDLREEYERLNRMTFVKFKKLSETLNLNIVKRRSRSFINKVPALQNINVNWGPMKLFVTKELLLLEKR